MSPVTFYLGGYWKDDLIKFIPELDSIAGYTKMDLDEIIIESHKLGYTVVKSGEHYIVIGKLEVMPPIEQLMASGDDLYCIAGGRMYEQYCGHWRLCPHFNWVEV